MTSENDEAIEGWILDKLSRRRQWGGKHTSFDNLRKGAPSHLADKIKDAAKELIKKGFIVVKPTNYGQEVSLNNAKREEILVIVEKWKIQHVHVK